MILDLGDEAKEFGRQALRAFEAAGGDELLQRAEAKPDAREGLVAPVLDVALARGNSTPAPTPTHWRPPPRCAAAPGTGHCRIRSPSGLPAPPTSTSTA